MTEGLKTLGESAALIVEGMRYRALVNSLHGKGPRVLAAFLAELGAERSIAHVIDQKLERYAALDRRAIEMCGADRMPPAPLRAVPDDGGEAAE